MSPPPSRSPAGVPESGGNAKYAIAAVILLLAAGGIFAWRSLTNRDQAPAPPPPVASLAPPTATNPKLDDIPPPPPPEEKPEGGPGVKYIYVPGGGCEGKCAGVSPPELGQALQVRAAQARRCYNSALASDSSLKGHVTIAVRVGPAGNVCSANVAANDMGSATVAACAANIFRNASYPAPRGGCVDATVPMSFVPMGGQ
jgi:hypothetical protein